MRPLKITMVERLGTALDVVGGTPVLALMVTFAILNSSVWKTWVIAVNNRYNRKTY